MTFKISNHYFEFYNVKSLDELKELFEQVNDEMEQLNCNEEYAHMIKNAKIYIWMINWILETIILTKLPSYVVELCI